MAKNNLSTPPIPVQDNPPGPGRPAHRVRRPALSLASKNHPLASRAPSAAVLVALAALAAARPVDDDEDSEGSSAAVPDFLCPALHAQEFQGSSATPPFAPQAATPPATASPQQRYLASRTAHSSSVTAADCSQPLRIGDTVVVSDDDASDTAHTHTRSDTSTTQDTDVNAHASRRIRSSKSVSAFSSQSSSLSRTRTRKTGRWSKRVDTDVDDDDDDDGTSQCSELYTSRTIPDRYELGNDGRWHKLSAWSSCSLCECESVHINDSSNNVISNDGVSNDATGDAEENSPVPAITSSTSASASSSGIPSEVSLILPDGWYRSSSSTVYQVPLIVVASLLLAAAVTCAVWFTFFWRRRQRVARQLAHARDLEKRRKIENNESDTEASEFEDDDDVGTGRRRRRMQRTDALEDRSRRGQNDGEKTKARWARATAQWKAHVRWIHRRRRGRTGIVEGLRQREDASASGVSLARSVASSRAATAVAVDTGSGNLVSDRNRESGGSAVGVPEGREQEAEMEIEPMSGIRVRAGERREGPLICEVGSTSESRRSSLPAQDENVSMAQDEGERIRARPRVRLEIPNVLPASLALAHNSDLPTTTSSTVADYDRPPPDILSIDRVMEGDVHNHGPPAYRSRGNVAPGSENRSRRNRGTRRYEKQAEGPAPGYVPAVEDCAPFSSDEEDEEEHAGEGEDARRSRRSRRSRSSERSARHTETSMHVAVDEKHALARLATFASAPPPPSPPLTRSSPSHLADSVNSSSVSHLTMEGANAPPEPELELEWAYEYDAEDTPGAGPGPSSVSARSFSPTSPSSLSRSCSPSRLSANRTHAYFPAPPKHVVSKLAYAPADAGLVHPRLETSYVRSLGFDDDFDGGMDDPGVPSAPPFSSHPDVYGDTGVNEDVLASASAPPLFPDDVESDELDDSLPCPDGLGGRESPDSSHIETADRNAVPSAVR